MGLFLSTFVNKIDKKGRVSVPASFRAALSGEEFQGIIAFRSYKLSAVDCMGSNRMQKISDSMDNLDLFSDDQDDLSAAIFADSQMLAFDGEGRIMLPQLLIDHASIVDKVAFVGRGATFQMWNPDQFASYQDDARRRVQEGKVRINLGSGNDK